MSSSSNSSTDSRARAIRAAAELELRRRRRERSFESWLHEVSPTWRWDWEHLRYMRRNLDDVTAGTLRFLMQFCPPRHGKSEQNTVRYAAYRIERDPTTRVIIAAYNLKLAKKFSRKVHALLKGRVEMNKAVQAADEWETAAGGGVRAAGIRTGVTGTGADLIIFDDPIKGRLEANSAAFREQLWDAFTDDFFTRMEPGCAILITLTRWHEQDLAGAVLKSEIASDWRVVNLPAIAEANDPLGRQIGEALCPDRYPIEELERRKRLMKANFWALFQGQPRPAEGNQYQRSWFRYWTRDPKSPDLIRLTKDDGRTKVVKLADCRVFITVDPATSEKQQADYTVFSTWAVTPDSDLILLDRWRGQESSPTILKTAFELQLTKKPTHFSVGAGGIGLPLIQNMRRGMVNEDGTRIPGLAVRSVPDKGDKLTKATTALIRTEAGQVYFPADAPWLPEWEDEILSFPNGSNDDQPDTLSTAAAEVFWIGGAGEPEEEQLAREAAEEKARKAEADAVRSDPDNGHWWPDDDD